METQWKLSNKYFILLFALFSFTIAKTQYDFDYYLPTTELNTITSDIAYSDLSLSSGEYLVIYGQGNTSGKIKKPFIIVEGFDMFDDQRIQNYIDLYNNNSSIFFLYELYTQGYDVIILDFDNAVDYIQNNAMLVVKLIEEVNAEKNTSDDDVVVMGYSMGGLVARYALTYMEANNMNHQCRLYVSHDAPHKGANIPLGLTEVLEDFAKHTSVAWIFASPTLYRTDNSMPAGQQMLVYHFHNSKDNVAEPHNKKIEFFNELYNLNPANNGYPSKPLKIAISNGNYSGNPQTGLSPGDIIFWFDYRRENPGCQYDPDCTCNLWQLIWGNCPDCWGVCYPYADDHITATVRAGFTDDQPLEYFYAYVMGFNPIPMGGENEQYFSSNNYAYDHVPGSHSSSYMDAIEDFIKDKFFTNNIQTVDNTCFIPTVSALDLNVGLSSSFDPNNVKCLTPFEYIYADNTSNFDHFYLDIDAKNFILNHLNKKEKPLKRTPDGDHITIPDNTIVQSNEIYNKTATGTIENEGAFNIKSEGSSTLVAGEKISLKPGFSTEKGANFSAYISDDICSDPIEYNPHVLAPNLKSSTNTYFETYYDCENKSEMPGYSSDSMYFNCGSDSVIIVYSTEKADSVLDENISIYPNPTTGQLTISMSNEITIEDLTINVYDPMDNMIYNFYPITSHEISFNISGYMDGLFIINFVFEVREIYIYTRKVMKN